MITSSRLLSVGYTTALQQVSHKVCADSELPVEDGIHSAH